MPASQRAWMKLWGVPIFMGVITIAGLLLAIMGADLWLHVLSWVALAIPLVAMMKYGAKFFR